MQSQNLVTVVEVDADGAAAREIGAAALVAPTIAVMRVANREAQPALLLRVLVPVAAGGDRDGYLDVTEVRPAENGRPYVALRLGAEAPAELVDEESALALARAIDPGSAASMTSAGPGQGKMGPTSAETASDHWLCRIFRICRG